MIGELHRVHWVYVEAQQLECEDGALVSDVPSNHVRLDAEIKNTHKTKTRMESVAFIKHKIEYRQMSQQNTGGKASTTARERKEQTILRVLEQTALRAVQIGDIADGLE